MTKYDELKKKANNYQHRLVYATIYRDNLENGIIVSKTNVIDNREGEPFIPYLTNKTANYYGFIDTDEFSEEEMDVLKALVRSHVERLKRQYEEAAVKLQAVEELLS